MKKMWLLGLVATAAVAACAKPAPAQKEKKTDEEFVREKPGIGDLLPDVVVYTPDGKEFKTADLRGHYTVLTFGCLT